jgi:DNA sulfur modification protein DndD
MRHRDKRVLQSVAGAVPSSAVDTFKSTLKTDLERLSRIEKHRPILQLSVNPGEIEDRISTSVANAKVSVETVLVARGALEKAERRIGAIPAEEQLGNLVTALGAKSKSLADAEATLAAATRAAVETQGRIAHLEIKINASRARLMVDFKDKSYEAKSLEAAARAKQAFILFKERMLASKAKWLSEMITNEFSNLLRKKNLFAKVLVDPVTYRVSIEDSKKHELPMDRLSAGERQLLAIAVLSALIKERKGRFPVVVDTPLARLDRQHRESLVRRFFSTVSHQVIVLSTDEEVEGSVYDALRPYTSREYVLHFDDATRSTKVEAAVHELSTRQIETAK